MWDVPAGLVTPALMVRSEVLERNLRSMAASARARGITLRPHAKTHKSPHLAHQQLDVGAVGLTVATLGEAEAFADAGVDDLFVAYPVWADASRAARIRALAERVRLRVGVDSVAGAQALARAARGFPLPVLVEVDSGHRRSGVLPAAAADVALAAAGSGLQVLGVFTFPGHSYAPGAAAAAAADEEVALRQASDGLAAAGLVAPVRSGGATPTADLTPRDGVTELRPGVYVFQDAQQVHLGTCGPDDVALAAAATVVSAPATDRVVLDAGSKTLGADRPAWMPGYGMLPDLPGAVVSSLSEHHAVVTLAPGTRTPVVGSTVAVVPNHVCAAVNLADELVVVEQGVLADRWPLLSRAANR